MDKKIVLLVSACFLVGGLYVFNYIEATNAMNKCLNNNGTIKLIDGYFAPLNACYIGENACILVDYYKGSCDIPSNTLKRLFNNFKVIT